MKFTYTVRTNKGMERGEMEAPSKNEAADILGQKGLIPLSIVEKKSFGISIASINALAPIPRVEKVMFSRQLSTLINAGIPLAKSLDILEKQTTNVGMKKALAGVLKDVEAGTSFSESLKKQPKAFNNIFVNMVHAGEVGGILDQTMERLADQIEKEHEMVSKIRGAMMYPLVIMVAMVGAVMFMMVSIIPQLGEMFVEMNAELPMSTKLLIGASHAITDYGIITFSIFGAIIYGLRYAIKNVYFIRKKFHFLILHSPVIGKASRKINIARFTRTFGTLMASGISIIETLNIVAEATNNIFYKEEIKKMAIQVKEGTPIGKTLENSKNFPILVAQMVAVGEETGSLSEILVKISEFYEKEVDGMIKNVASLLEPLMMILIGSMIGFIMISIIKPIYQLTSMF